MSERAFALDPVIEAPGQLPPKWQEQLVQCVVEDSTNLPTVAMLTFRDPNHDLLAETGITIGTLLRVSVTTVATQGRTLLFAGEVTALEIESDETGTFTVVRALDRAHRLFRGRKVVAFRNMTARDIIRRIATGARLTPGRIEAAGITYEQLTQANVTDWEFLRMLAEEHGAVVDVDTEGRLSFTKPKPATSAPSPQARAAQNPAVLEYGENLLSLRASLTAAEQVASVEVRGWDITTKRPLIGRSRATTSNTLLAGVPPGEATRRFGGTPKLLITETPYRKQAEVDAAAKAQAAASAAGFGELEAVCEGNPKLRIGIPITLAKVGKAFSGKYIATATRHVLEPGSGYRTCVTVSANQDRSLAGLVSGASAPATSPRIPGLAIGVVTDVKEPGGRGRGWVRLRFPWLSDTYITDWVRTVQFGGVGGGGVFCPEVNDEVLVGFEQGNLDRPYVLGGLYNGVDLPSKHDVPLVDPTRGKINRRSLVSRSGNRIELLDARTGLKGVRLRTGNDRLELYLDQQRTSIIVRSDGTVEIEARRQVTVTGQGVTIDAGRGELTLKGRSVSVSATTGVEIDGGAQAVLRGRMVRIN